MRRIELAAAEHSLMSLLDESDDEPFVLMNDGKPVAVLWPTPGADMETVSLMLNPRFLRMLEESRESAEREGTVSHAEVRRLLSESGEAQVAVSQTKTRAN